MLEAVPDEFLEVDGEPVDDNASVLSAKVQASISVLTLMLSLFIAPMCGWIALTVAANSNRLTILETSRFSVSDGALLSREIQEIRKEMSQLPPVEWRARVRAMEIYLAQRDKSFHPAP